MVGPLGFASAGGHDLVVTAIFNFAEVAVPDLSISFACFAGARDEPCRLELWSVAFPIFKDPAVSCRCVSHSDRKF